MNGLQQLINQLCPNGVEKKPLWQLTAWDKHFNGVDKSMQKKTIQYKYLLANDLFALEAPNGTVKLLSTGTQTGWTTEELAGDYLCEGEVVTIPWGKSLGAKEPVKYYKGKFVTGDNRIATSIDTNILSNKFLYYWMISNINDIELLYRGAGIKHPDMKGVLSLQIPLPPLAIQSRIVEILDHFTNLTANLTAELALRRKQFEHFREKLLSLDGVEGVEMKTLGEVCEFVNGFAFKSSLFRQSGSRIIRITNIDGVNINTNDSIYFDCNDYKEDLSKYIIKEGDIAIAMSGATTGKIGRYIDNDYSYINQRVGLFKPKKCLSVSFLYHFLLSKSYDIYLLAGGGAQPNLGSNSLMTKVKIPVPPLAVQHSIVEKLDKFTALILNIENELALRQKQYEYYREKLLSFPSPSL